MAAHMRIGTNTLVNLTIPAEVKQSGKAVLFGIMAITGMTFSPIGEELFFRGIVHSSFEDSIGERKASIVDSSAFAITHISHFGLVFVNNGWSFFIMPTIIWVLNMFLVSLLFFFWRKQPGSLLGPIVSHSAFNLGNDLLHILLDVISSGT